MTHTASYPQLFGTATGKLLQQWCIRNGWALLWAPGFDCLPGNTLEICNATLGGDNYSHTFWNSNRVASGVLRAVDPVVQQQTARRLNLSAVDVGIAASAFAVHWDAVGKRVAAGTMQPGQLMTPAWWASWYGLAAELPPAFGVRAARAHQCVDQPRCVGVVTVGLGHPNSSTPIGDCICYSSN